MMTTTVEERIFKYYSKLSKSEKLVADFILYNDTDITHMTLSELAIAIKVSEPTIIRFTKSIDLKGFTELKLELMKDIGLQTVYKNDKQEDLLFDLHISPEDEISDIPELMYKNTQKGLSETYKLIDKNEFQKAIKVLNNANLIEIFGVGNSGAIAHDMMSKLVRIGLPARYTSDNHIQQLNILGLKKNDVAFAITHSGSTIDVIETLKLAKKNGVTTIALTNFKAHYITKYADIILYTGDYESAFFTETMVSRLSQLMIIDMIYMGIILSDYKKYTDHLDKVNIVVTEKNLE